MESPKNVNDLSVETSAQKFTSDWKYEVVAACLCEQGYDKNRILINRLGNRRRNVTTEIEELTLQFTGDENNDTYLEIGINKASIYDSLPEGIFHASIYPGQSKSKEQVVKEIQIHNNQEYFIRRFFRLFEAELDFNRIDIQLCEMRFDKQDTYRSFSRVFEPYWPILKVLSLKQANVFLKHTPYFNELRKDIQAIGRTISDIVDAPVTIKPAYSRHLKAADGVLPILSKMKLGRNAVLSGYFYDGNTDYAITIGDIRASQVKDFLPGATMRLIIERLCALLLPADAETTFKITVIPEERTARLFATSQTYPCYLGINTYLK